MITQGPGTVGPKLENANEGDLTTTK